MTVMFGPPDLPTWMETVDLCPESNILDVGCGSGNALIRLANHGFSNLVGVDPYVSEDIIYPNGVRIYKRSLSGMEGEYDFIMLHHSFEHFCDPADSLGALSRLLHNDGVILIRIPVMPCYAWRTYGTKWVQLDAPRHPYLHSKQSMAYLAEHVGLRIERIAYDSSAFQFWGSEQYIQDIPLVDERSHSRGFGRSLFTQDQICEFNSRARALNEAEDGDQACFYLRKVSQE